MSKKNLANPNLKKLWEKLDNGEEPQGGKRAVKHIYKHPVKRREVIISSGQHKAVRRG